MASIFKIAITSFGQYPTSLRCSRFARYRSAPLSHSPTRQQTNLATYRASPSAYVVLGAVWLLLGVLGAAGAARTQMGWLPVSIAFAVLAVVVVWLRSFRLTITEKHLTYRSLFGGERSVELHSISAIGLARRTGPYESPMTAVVTINGEPDLRVNTKVFPREAGDALLSLKPSLD